MPLQYTLPLGVEHHVQRDTGFMTPPWVEELELDVYVTPEIGLKPPELDYGGVSDSVENRFTTAGKVTLHRNVLLPSVLYSDPAGWRLSSGQIPRTGACPHRSWLRYKRGIPRRTGTAWLP